MNSDLKKLQPKDETLSLSTGILYTPLYIACMFLSIALVLGCEGDDQEEMVSNAGSEETTAGDFSPEAGESAAMAGEPASEAGESAPEAGESAPEAGESAPEAGESASEAGESASEAGESASEAGESSPEAGNEIIIETNEGGEDWTDPEDFGEPGEGIHAFTMIDIDGEEVDMRRYRGRVALVVNVASRCGYTSQYTDLQRLYSDYSERGLVILGFPANNFGSQEPGTDEEIAEFCSANYGVSFPMFSKISVKGADIHPLYAYLTTESGQEVQWNFNKFLVGRDGLYVNQYLSSVTPYADELIAAIEVELAREE